MKLPVWMVSIVLGASIACGGEEDAAAGTPAQPEEAQPLVQEPEAPPVQEPETPPVQEQAAQPEPPPSAPSSPLVDEPWVPEFTGTVSPGMTRDEVVAAWGEPVVERTAGNLTFMYFRNGCEATCGTHDVVFLEDGQVVDAIVRFAGHTYTGVSSSPPDRAAEFTPPVPTEGTTGTP
jgi:hypothetical protein